MPLSLFADEEDDSEDEEGNNIRIIQESGSRDRDSKDDGEVEGILEADEEDKDDDDSRKKVSEQNDDRGNKSDDNDDEAPRPIKVKKQQSLDEVINELARVDREILIKMIREYLGTKGVDFFNFDRETDSEIDEKKRPRWDNGIKPKWRKK